MKDENQSSHNSIRCSWGELQSMAIFWLFIIALVIQGILLLETGRINWVSLADNLAVGLIQAAITFYIFDRVVEQRDTERDKERLLREMGGPDNAFALRAVRELRAKGWLTDKSIRAVDFANANLTQAQMNDATLLNVNLYGANLAKVNLRQSDLRASDLWNANLENADLNGADCRSCKLLATNLREATLTNVNFQFSNLCDADFEGAFVAGADFRNTALIGANLKNIRYLNISQPIFDETTILPDESQWTPDTDIKRFTDPTHPQFWRSDDINSPAYDN